MANALYPFGFRIARHMSALGQELNDYALNPATAVSIAVGDAVKSDGAGGITKAAAGDALLGFFAGAWITTRGQFGGSQNFAANGQIPYFKVWIPGSVLLPPGSSLRCQVHDDPNILIEAQCSQTITRADIGSFVDLVDAVPDTVFGRSNQTVGTPGGTASQFRIEKVLEQPMRNVNPAYTADTIGYSLSGEGRYALVQLRMVKHERGGAAMAIAV